MKLATFLLLGAFLVASCSNGGPDDDGPCWERGEHACERGSLGETIDTRCLDPACCDAFEAAWDCQGPPTGECSAEDSADAFALAAAECHVTDEANLDYFACQRACDSL